MAFRSAVADIGVKRLGLMLQGSGFGFLGIGVSVEESIDSFCKDYDSNISVL